MVDDQKATGKCVKCGRTFRGKWDTHEMPGGKICHICFNQAGNPPPKREISTPAWLRDETSDAATGSAAQPLSPSPNPQKETSVPEQPVREKTPVRSLSEEVPESDSPQLVSASKLVIICDCGQEMGASLSALGRTGTCIRCGKKIKISEKNTRFVP